MEKGRTTMKKKGRRWCELPGSSHGWQIAGGLKRVDTFHKPAITQPTPNCERTGYWSSLTLDALRIVRKISSMIEHVSIERSVNCARLITLAKFNTYILHSWCRTWTTFRFIYIKHHKYVRWTAIIIPLAFIRTCYFFIFDIFLSPTEEKFH